MMFTVLISLSLIFIVCEATFHTRLPIGKQGLLSSLHY